MENKKSFGDYIRAKRTEAGFTQKVFADKLYVTESAVSKWERGLSYPDITLISDICEVLQVSEHELLTASEDTEARNHEKLAKRYINLIERLKIIQYFIYGIPLIVCFICNIAVNHNLSWFFIVLASEAVAASLTLLPVMAEKKRGLIVLAGFTLSLLVLLAVCCIYTGGDWYLLTFISVLFGIALIFLPSVLKSIYIPAPFGSHIVLSYFIINSLLLFVLLLTADLYTGEGNFIRYSCPFAGFSLILPWGMMLIIRYARINGFFKTSGCLALSGAMFYIMDRVFNAILGTMSIRSFQFNFNDWSYENLEANINAVILFSLFGLTAAFAAAGMIFELLRTRKSKV